MRVPDTGEEYRRLAFDICTIFFFAIMFYYCLMWSVAHETREMTLLLEGFDQPQSRNVTPVNTPGRLQASDRKATVGKIAGNATEWEQCRKHFAEHMRHEMNHVTSKEFND